MSLLTYISGVPLFSTLIEAIEWGENRGLTGYHTHDYEGQIQHQALVVVVVLVEVVVDIKIKI